MSETAEVGTPKVVRKTMLAAPEGSEMKPYAKDFEFGCVIDSIPGRINRALRTSPKNVKQVSEETGIAEKRVQAHFDYFADKDWGVGHFLVKSDEGYALKA